MGTHVNLYNGSGKVIRTAGWYYNGPTSSGFSRITPSYKSSSGTYYTQSTNRLYTRSTGKYATFSAIRSPKISARNLDISISSEELNEREYLYQTKNMIAAVGEDNKEGYINVDELYGETVIGEYRIDFNFDNVELIVE